MLSYLEQLMEVVFPTFVHVGHFLFGYTLGPPPFVLCACASGVVVVSDEVDEASVRYRIRDYVLRECRLPMSNPCHIFAFIETSVPWTCLQTERGVR